MSTLVIAHRASAGGAPENSIAGIRQAVALGADAVEVDVRRTLEGTPVLLHDPTLRRTAGLRLPVRAVPLPVVRRLSLAGGEPIPTVEEALDALPAHALLVLELKESGAARRVLEAVTRRRLDERVMLWCWRTRAIRLAARVAPKVETAFLKYVSTEPEIERFLQAASGSGARAVSVPWAIGIAPGFVDGAHDRGIRVYSMAPGPESHGQGVAARLDGIITRWVAEARAAVDSAAVR